MNEHVAKVKEIAIGLIELVDRLESESLGVDYFVDLLVKAILAAPDKRLPIVCDERDYAREYRRGKFSFCQNLDGLSIKWKEE